MSAYICNLEHIGILAACAVLGKSDVSLSQFDKDDPVLTAQAIAKALAKENIRSVAHRYPNDEDGGRPGPGLKDAEIIEGAALYAGYFVKNPAHAPALSPVTIYKLCQSYEYQACETDDWPSTDAAQQINRIKDKIIQGTAGYDAAPWSISLEIPALAALIYEAQK